MEEYTHSIRFHRMTTRLFVCCLFLVSLPALSLAKGQPMTTIVLSEERAKKTELGVLHFKGKVVLWGKHPAKLEDKAWQQAHLDRGTLSREIKLRGLTISAESQIEFDSNGHHQVRVSFIIPADLEICGVTFTRSVGFRFDHVQKVDGVVDFGSPFTGVDWHVGGYLKEDTVVAGLPIKAGVLRFRVSHRAFMRNELSAISLVEGTMSRKATIYRDIVLEPGDKVSADPIAIVSRLDESHWLHVTPRDQRRATVRGYENVRWYDIDTRTGNIARLFLYEPIEVKGFLTKKIDFYASGEVHEVALEKRANWKGMSVGGTFSFWPDGTPQQVMVSAYFPGMRQAKKTLQGVPLLNISTLRFNPKGELCVVRRINDWLRVRDGKLTKMDKFDALGSPSDRYCPSWVAALAKAESRSAEESKEDPIPSP